jgi:phosphatidylserine/phosphatidylglycerophosphate/cardiolipin synthase-like enzyme
MIVDRRDVCLGSANFDWRSLEHIQELGVRAVTVGEALAPLFDADWRVAEHGGDLASLKRHGPYVLRGDRVSVVASPGPGDEWDLPRLLAGITAARKLLRVQLLNYRTRHYDGRPFMDLHEALASAVTRGVAVRMLLSNWSTKYLPSLRQLSDIGVQLRIISIPEHSGGFVPFARVAHSKYMVVDDATAWIGSSNWSGDYFHASRNVGLWIEGDELPQRLAALFDELYTSVYTEPFDPQRDYEPPKLQ